MIDPRTPVLVGVGEASDRTATAGSPLDLLARAAGMAVADTGATRAIAFDTVAVVRLFADSSPAFASPFGGYANLPRSLAHRLARRRGPNSMAPSAAIPRSCSST